MKTYFIIHAVLLFLFISCTSNQITDATIPEGSAITSSAFSGVSITKSDSIAKEGTTVEIRGMAWDRKGGAVVATDSVHYWMDDREWWEEKYNGKEVIVKGTLVKRNDNPVFLDTSEIKSQGIPVHSEEELKSQVSRYWIINPEVSLVGQQ